MQLLLRNPKFRIYWIAGAFGDISLLTFFTVHGWLVLQITDSPFWVGVSSGIGGIAMTICAPWGGVIVDRFSKVDALRIAGLFRFVGAICIAGLLITDSIALWHVLVMSFAAGITGAVRVPGMMALNLDIVGRENLLGATAARMTSMLSMGVAVPLAVGQAVDSLGIEWAYVTMAGGDLLAIVLVSLLAVSSQARSSGGSPLEDLRVGIRYSVRSPLVRTLLGVIMVNELFGWAHEPMLPVFTKEVLLAGASGLGLLLAAGSAGGTVSTFALASVGDLRRKGMTLALGVLGYGIFLVAFSASESLPVAMALLALAYSSAILYETIVNTLLQTCVPDNMRGRVLSFQAMMWGLTGITGFHTGAVASLIGAPLAIGAGGVIVILNAARLIPKVTRIVSEAESMGVPAD